MTLIFYLSIMKIITVRYAVRDAVIILGTILKCYSQMKASKPYFPSEAVSRLYLMVCVFNHEVWLCVVLCAFLWF